MLSTPLRAFATATLAMYKPRDVGSLVLKGIVSEEIAHSWICLNMHNVQHIGLSCQQSVQNGHFCISFWSIGRVGFQ